jgi:hypothetical protein
MRQTRVLDSEAEDEVVDCMFDWVTSLITGGPLVLIMIYILKNPEKAEKWVSIGARLGSHFSRAAEKRSVSGDIQADINAFAKSVNSKIDPTILPYGIQIRWQNIEDASYDSFVNEGNLVVRMKHHSNQARNIAVATLAYVRGGLLPETRPYLHADVSEGLNLSMTRKILMDRKRLDAFQLFARETAICSEPEVIRLCKVLDDLDAIGMFEPLVLREFADLGKTLGGVPPNAAVKNETKDFVDFGEKLAEKTPGVDISPDFHRRFLRVSIILIAKLTTYASRGLSPYTNAVDRCFKDEVNSIYVCARGVNITAAEYLDEWLKGNQSWRRVGAARQKILDPRGNKVDGICIAYKRVNS